LAVKPLSFRKPAANEIDVLLRRGNAALGFLLESVQHVYHFGKLHGVHGAISVGIVTIGLAAGSVSPIWAA
jgi:hypothetical protein